MGLGTKSELRQKSLNLTLGWVGEQRGSEQESTTATFVTVFHFFKQKERLSVLGCYDLRRKFDLISWRKVNFRAKEIVAWMLWYSLKLLLDYLNHIQPTNDFALIAYSRKVFKVS